MAPEKGLYFLSTESTKMVGTRESRRTSSDSKQVYFRKYFAKQFGISLFVLLRQLIPGPRQLARRGHPIQKANAQIYFLRKPEQINI